MQRGYAFFYIPSNDFDVLYQLSELLGARGGFAKEL